MPPSPPCRYFFASQLLAFVVIVSWLLGVLTWTSRLYPCLASNPESVSQLSLSLDSFGIRLVQKPIEDTPPLGGLYCTKSSSSPGRFHSSSLSESLSVSDSDPTGGSCDWDTSLMPVLSLGGLHFTQALKVLIIPTPVLKGLRRQHMAIVCNCLFPFVQGLGYN